MKKINFYTSVIISSFLSILGIGIIFFAVYIPVIMSGGIVHIDTNHYGEMWYEFILFLFLFLLSIFLCISNLIKIKKDVNQG